MKFTAGLALLFSTLFPLFGLRVFGQSTVETPLNCRINRISPTDHSLEVNCVIIDPPADKTTIQFVDEFAGISRLSERLRAVKLADALGARLPLEIRGNGLYVFNAGPHSRTVTLTYEMHLARALDPSQYALVSTVGTETAVLMMGDLLPRMCFGENCEARPNAVVRMTLEPPAGWRIATTEPRQGEAFEIAALSQAVFFIGRLREQTVKLGEKNLHITTSGEWSFRDEEHFSLVEAIAREQATMIGGQERGDFLVTLAPFPQPLTGLRSSAMTIGRTVVLLLNPNNDAAQTVKHYRRHLAHEMFHFYLPNAFRVRENFDWFWEGFTRYAALMTLARLHLVDLREYLDAINAEYEAYLFNPSRRQYSLLSASPEKFASAGKYDLVYRKGMLVAALYDLELRWQSRGKYNLADVMKELYQNYALAAREMGNREVLQELGRRGNFSRLISDGIAGTKEIDLIEMVKPYGLILGTSFSQGTRARLLPSSKLTDRQREFIGQLASSAAPDFERQKR